MSPQAGHLRRGTVLGGYRLLEPLGEGGMGVVYRAVQLSLEREVALKLLSSNVAGDPEQRRRFLQEGLLAAKASHPRLVHVLEAGEAQSQVFIAYELMRGRTLRGELATVGRLSLEAAVETVAACAEALSALHALGILHRDVKPENIFLEPGRGALLGDLGIAKDLGGGGVKTDRGVILGTPGYLAPELILGKPASAASDLYALGSVLFECLAGRLPFDSKDPQELLRAHLAEFPPPLANFRPELPAAVPALVAATLGKDPAGRPSDAATFAERLRAAAAGPSPRPGSATMAISTARPRSGPATRTLASRPAPVPRPPRRWLLAACVAVAAGLAGWGLFRPLPEKPPSPPDQVRAGAHGSPAAPLARPVPAVPWREILQRTQDELLAMRASFEAAGKYYQALASGQTAAPPPGTPETPGTARPRGVPAAAVRRFVELYGLAARTASNAFRTIEPVADPAHAELTRACGKVMLQLFYLYDLARGCLWPVFDRAIRQQQATAMLQNIFGGETRMQDFEVAVADLVAGLNQSLPPALRQTADPFCLAGLAILKGMMRQRARSGADSARLSADVADLASRALPGLTRPGGKDPHEAALVDVLLTGLRLSGVGPLRLKLVEQALEPYQDPAVDSRLSPHDEVIRCRLAAEQLLLRHRTVDLFLETQANLKLQYDKWRELELRFRARWPYDPLQASPTEAPAGPEGDRLREAISHHGTAMVCCLDIRGNLDRIRDLLQDHGKTQTRR